MFVTVSLLTFLKILGKAGDEEAKLKAQQLLKDKLKMQQKKIESLESLLLQLPLLGPKLKTKTVP